MNNLQYIIVHTKSEATGLFVIVKNNGQANMYLMDKISDEVHKYSIAFNGNYVIVSTLTSNSVLQIYELEPNLKIQTELITIKGGSCNRNVASSFKKEFVISIFSKCKDQPGEVLTYTSSNMKIYNKQTFVPRVNLFGEEPLDDICIYTQGKLFVTKSGVFMLDDKSNVLVKTTHFYDGQDYKVKCLFNNLMAVINQGRVQIYDMNKFYNNRYKNAQLYDVKDVIYITEGGDGGFYATSHSYGAETPFKFYTLYWKNIDIYGKFRKSQSLDLEMLTGMLNDKPSPLQIQVQMQDGLK